jgi:hypothetical protein
MFSFVSTSGRISAQIPRITKTLKMFDDVADRHVAVARRSREHRDHQFGHRGADGDDRQADDEFRDAEMLGYRRRAVRQEICAAEDQPQADE